MGLRVVNYNTNDINENEKQNWWYFKCTMRIFPIILYSAI